MPKYNVTVYYRGMYEAEIEADNEKEAAMYGEEDASNEIFFSDCETTTSVEEVEE